MDVFDFLLRIFDVFRCGIDLFFLSVRLRPFQNFLGSLQV